MRRRTKRLRLGDGRVRVRRGRLAEIQLTSTSDIAFLLLIFFLATAVFVSQVGLPLVLPPAGAAPLLVAEADVLVLRIDAQGEVRIAEQPVPADALAGWAQDRERERPGRVWLLEVDRRCPYHRLVAVLDALREAAVERVSFRRAGTAR